MIKHILVVRINPKSLKLGLSKPCTVCRKLLIDYEVEQVTYSSQDDEFVTERVEDMIHT